MIEFAVRNSSTIGNVVSDILNASRCLRLSDPTQPSGLITRNALTLMHISLERSDADYCMLAICLKMPIRVLRLAKASIHS